MENPCANASHRCLSEPCAVICNVKALLPVLPHDHGITTDRILLFQAVDLFLDNEDLLKVLGNKRSKR